MRDAPDDIPATGRPAALVRVTAAPSRPAAAVVRAIAGPLAASAADVLARLGEPCPGIRIALEPDQGGLVRGRTAMAGRHAVITLCLLPGDPRVRATLAHEMAHVVELACRRTAPASGWASWAARLRSEYLAEQLGVLLADESLGWADPPGAGAAAEWMVQMSLDLCSLADIAAAARPADGAPCRDDALRAVNAAVSEALVLAAYASGALCAAGGDPRLVLSFPGLPDVAAAAIALLMSPLWEAPASWRALADGDAVWSERGPGLFREAATAIGSAAMAAG